MAGELRSGHHEPNVPAKDGVPPNWYVVCLTCGFAHDAHGASASEALSTIGATHDPKHKLTARPVDYTTHPLYK